MKFLDAKLAQAACQCNAVQEARVKRGTKGQSPQTAWQGDAFQVLVEVPAEGQSLQVVWQDDT